MLSASGKPESDFNSGNLMCNNIALCARVCVCLRREGRGCSKQYLHLPRAAAASSGKTDAEQSTSVYNRRGISRYK